MSAVATKRAIPSFIRAQMEYWLERSAERVDGLRKSLEAQERRVLDIRAELQQLEGEILETKIWLED